jgi:phosphatidylglycerol---prolipoprotein diacylglyceryl transferase
MLTLLFQNLLSIIWDVSPFIFNFDLPLLGRPLGWYGLFFALGFVIGQQIMSWIFKKEGRPEQKLESLLIWMVLSTVIGARLGHCLFYEPAYYLTHPLDILKVYEGGLASHGASVGILIGIFIYARRNPEFTYFYLLDRLVIVIALSGAFIRLGNLMNSEIVGKATDVAWGFVFKRNLTTEGFPEDFARHPSQLYESLFCFLLFGLLLLIYLQKKENTASGRLLGWFLVLLFIQRILVEFTKENQVSFENSLFLNMGQILSLPLVFVGIFILYRSYTKPLNI